MENNRLPKLGFKIVSNDIISIGELYSSLNTLSLFGMELPSFQRKLVWTEKQNIALIESVIQHIPIGSYMVNYTNYGDSLDNLLIDGQQRLNALHLYFNNAFPVFGLYWNDLTVLEKRQIRMESRITRVETHIKDEAHLREVYNRFNFGGTAHKDSERA